MGKKVALQRCESYRREKVGSAVRKVLNLLDFHKLIKGKKKILLKPNLVKGARPEDCITTHPAVVSAVAGILKQSGCDIYLGDCPFHDGQIRAMKESGLYAACMESGIKIAIFDAKMDAGYDKSVVVKKFQLTRHFEDMDAIINLPKLKTHSQLYFTGAVKNLYSMMPGPRRGFYHLKYPDMEHFANMLLDLYAILRKKVVLNIFDGVYGMEGNGPCNGSPKHAGVISGSTDAVALDYVMCKLAGLDTGKLSTIFYAKKRSDFRFDPMDIRIVGDKLEEISPVPFREAEFHTLNMMPKFVNEFREYISGHKDELVY